MVQRKEWAAPRGGGGEMHTFDCLLRRAGDGRHAHTCPSIYTLAQRHGRSRATTMACFLEWNPWESDRVMGLNHQMSSLSCALGEAFFLNRTLLVPHRICLDAKHEARQRGLRRQIDESCTARGIRAFSVPTSELIDLDLLGRVVSIAQTALPRRAGVSGGSIPAPESAVDIDRSWKSDRVAASLPCSAGTRLVRRRVSGFWFRPCGYGITDTRALMAALLGAVGARSKNLASARVLPHLLRSGLFYSRAIKRAARAVRRSIGSAPPPRRLARASRASRRPHRELGGPFASLHLRRGDKFSSGCERAQFSLEECAFMDEHTRPEKLLSALRLWLPPGTRLLIGSTEPAAFFAPLRSTYTLHFVDDFRSACSDLAAITTNYALYAVETLLFFASTAHARAL